MSTGLEHFFGHRVSKAGRSVPLTMEPTLLLCLIPCWALSSNSPLRNTASPDAPVTRVFHHGKEGGSPTQLSISGKLSLCNGTRVPV